MNGSCCSSLPDKATQIYKATQISHDIEVPEE